MAEETDVGTQATAPAENPTPAAEPASAPAADPTPAAEAAQSGTTMAEQSVGGENVLDQAEETTPAAPEAYEAFKDDDGREYDAESLKDFTDAAKELGLTQEGAQKMFKAMRPSMQGVFIREITERNKEWVSAAQTDKEYGGTAFKANMAVAKTAYDKYASAELKQIFAKTGLGNNPEIIRLFYRVGKAISPDSGVGGTGGAPRSMTSPRYPNTPGMKDD